LEQFWYTLAMCVLHNSSDLDIRRGICKILDCGSVVISEKDWVFSRFVGSSEDGFDLACEKI
jgi:hypothetical protein